MSVMVRGDAKVGVEHRSVGEPVVAMTAATSSARAINLPDANAQSVGATATAGTSPIGSTAKEESPDAAGASPERTTAIGPPIMRPQSVDGKAGGSTETVKSVGVPRAWSVDATVKASPVCPTAAEASANATVRAPPIHSRIAVKHQQARDVVEVISTACIPYEG